jgi:hypothetical protein
MLLRWLLWLTLTVGMPICFYWTAFLAFATRPLPEGDCLFYAVFPVVPVIFAVADAILASGMLIIFLLPLWQHQDVIKATVANNAKYGKSSFQRMINRNIRLSLLAIVSGLIGLSGLSAFNWASDGTSATEHFPTWGLFIISFDNIASVSACHCLTFKWLPNRIFSLLGFSRGGNSSTRDGETSPTRSKNKREDRTVRSSDKEQSSLQVTPAYAIEEAHSQQ